MKKLLCVLLLLAVLVLPACQYRREIITDGASLDEVAPTEALDDSFKWYSQSEFEEITQSHKYPKRNVLEQNKVVTVNRRVDSKGNIAYLEYKVDKVTFIDNISSLDERGFYEFDKWLSLWLDSDKSFVGTYPRGTIHHYNGGLDSDTRFDKDARVIMALVEYTVTNTSNVSVEAHIPPETVIYDFEDFDSEFYIEANDGAKYYNQNESDEHRFQPWRCCVYFPQSQYKDSDNQMKKGHRFFWYELKPQESVKLTAGYLVDEDLTDKTYISFSDSYTQFANQFITLVKLTDKE